MREQEILKRNKIFEEMQEKRKAKGSLVEKRRSEFKEYLDRIATKGKKALTEGAIISGNSFTKKDIIQDRKIIFSGSVSDIVEKANKMLESKKNEIFISRIKSEAKSAISKIISETSDEKVLTEAFKAIKSLSHLKEEDDKEMTDEEKKKADEEEQAKKDKEKEDEEKAKSESAKIEQAKVLEESANYEMPQRAFEIMKEVR